MSLGISNVYFVQGNFKVRIGRDNIALSGPKPELHICISSNATRASLEERVTPVGKMGHWLIYTLENVRLATESLFVLRLIGYEELLNIYELVKQNDYCINYTSKAVNKMSQPLIELINEFIEPYLAHIMQAARDESEARYLLSLVLDEWTYSLDQFRGGLFIVHEELMSHPDAFELIESISCMRRVAFGKANFEQTFERYHEDAPPSLRAVRHTLVNRFLAVLEDRFPDRSMGEKFLAALELIAYVYRPGYSRANFGRSKLIECSQEPRIRLCLFKGDWENILFRCYCKYSDRQVIDELEINGFNDLAKQVAIYHCSSGAAAAAT